MKFRAVKAIKCWYLQYWHEEGKYWNSFAQMISNDEAHAQWLADEMNKKTDGAEKHGK